MYNRPQTKKSIVICSRMLLAGVVGTVGDWGTCSELSGVALFVVLLVLALRVECGQHYDVGSCSL